MYRWIHERPYSAKLPPGTSVAAGKEAIKTLNLQ